jgi:prepilin-type N-terminal cleavage/methylation domain-containing protein
MTPRFLTHARGGLHRTLGAKGFTLVELLLVIGVVAILLALIPCWIPRKSKHRANQISCRSNLKHVALGFQIAKQDSDMFPVMLATKEQSLRTTDVAIFFRALSNELATPRVLVCRANGQQPAVSFDQLSANNLSFFFNVSAPMTTNDSASLLYGDRHVTGGRKIGKLLIIQADDKVAWAAKPHREAGNAAFTDGSAHITSSRELQQMVRNQTTPPRLLLP